VVLKKKEMFDEIVKNIFKGKNIAEAIEKVGGKE
jgi:hypothetical protein